MSEAGWNGCMQEAHSLCEAIVRSADRDRYLTALFLPAAVRPHAFAILAFNAEVSAIRGRAREPLAGEVRLQWWRDVLAGTAAGGIEGSPVATALVETIETQRLPYGIFERLIEAHEFDLYDDPMPSSAALDAYVRLTSSSLFELIGHLLIGESSSFAAAASHAGLAYGMTEILRALPLHASRGQIYLPADLLARHRVDPGSILTGRTTPALRNAIGELRTEARDRRRKLDRLLSELPREARSAFLPLVLTDAYLSLMERPSYDPFRTPVEFSQFRRQWKLWRAARRMP